MNSSGVVVERSTDSPFVVGWGPRRTHERSGTFGEQSVDEAADDQCIHHASDQTPPQLVLPQVHHARPAVGTSPGLAGILRLVTDRPEDPVTGFADLLEANASFAGRFTSSGLDGVARLGVGIVTCMDSRIDPLGMLGLAAGDAKILRDLGARVTEEVLSGLVIATTLLGVTRVLLVAHTRCAAVSNSQNELRDRVGERAHADASWMSFRVVGDQSKALREDVAKVRSHPLIPAGTLVGGFIYDVDTGRLRQVH